MARKIKDMTAADVEALRPKTGFRPGPFKVAAVVYEDAVRMHTVEPDSHLWNGRNAITVTAPLFVRLKPPPGTEPAAVEQLKQSYLKAGALAVRVVQPAEAGVVTGGAAVDREPAPHRAIREVVAEVVSEANTQDRPALAALVEAAMAKAGL